MIVFLEPMFAQEKAYEDDNLTDVRLTSAKPFSFNNIKFYRDLAEEKSADKELSLIRATDKNLFPYKFDRLNKSMAPLVIPDIFDLYALKTSLDFTGTKYKDDYYERELLAKIDFEAIVLLGDILSETIAGQNSIIMEDGAKPRSYFQLRTGLRVSGRGDVQKADNGDKYKTYIYYLTLPLYILYNQQAANERNKFFAGLGPYYGYGLFGKFVDEINGETIKENIKFGENESGLRHGDFGLGFVVGYVFDRVLVQLSYDLGLSNITFDDEFKAYNRAFGVSVGYVLHK
jgi:hypothetical protein